MDKIKITFLFNVISLVLLIISFAFILAQNIINLIFYAEKRKDIIAEKYIYEQFSHEVYSNINSRIYYNIDEHSSDSEIIKFPLKFDYLYDCEDVDDDKIDKECQNKITSPSLCCELSCCRDYVKNKEKYHKCSNKNNFNDYDSRENICSKSSIYNGNFYYIYSRNYDARRYSKTYEELLLEANNDNNCLYRPIQFDTKGNTFCDNDNIIENGRVIVQNIISTIEPKYIDIHNSLRIDILLNKKEYDESKILKEKRKLNEISYKNIKDAFLEKDEDYNYYSIYQTFKMSDLISGNEAIFENYKSNNYYDGVNIYWYTRNYIGFKNYQELKNFKKYFDENDHKNNCLYKFSNSNIIFGISITSVILIIIFIILIVLKLLHLLKNMNEINIQSIPYDTTRKIFMIFSSFDFLFFLIIYLACFICKYDYIDIDMETFFKKVLDKYNKRRNQIYLFIGFIISFISLLLSFFYIYILECFKSNASLNVRPNNILVVKFRLDEGNCEHKIKIDKNKTLNDYINKMENILERCNKCNNIYLGVGIDNIHLNDRNLNLNQRIEEFRIDENSLLIIIKDE